MRVLAIQTFHVIKVVRNCNAVSCEICGPMIMGTSNSTDNFGRWIGKSVLPGLQIANHMDFVVSNFRIGGGKQKL